MKILITGGSGLVGSHLTDFLIQRGHEVAHLGRKKNCRKNIREFVWDLEKGIVDEEAIHWAEAIVHLAGASVADGRWTDARKKEIVDSRVKGPQLLSKILRNEKNIPKIFVSASAAGWYGNKIVTKVFTENDLPATDFLAEVCRKWEAAADLMEEVGMRTVKLRIGIVLAKDGGALPKLCGPVKWFFGSALGSGKQWMPWIHIDDLCELFLKAIEDKTLEGVYNAVASAHCTNAEFVETIGKVLHRPVFFPRVPEFILKMMLGEKAEMVIGGSRVSNEKILKSGVVFKYNQLEGALGDLLG